MKNSGINTTKNMGARVRQVLDELGWKQIDLLNRVVELDTGTLSALINRNGKTCLWSDEIAEALGVNHRWLQRGEGPKKRPAGEWPFQKLSLEDVLALPESERARIEGYAQRAIEDFRRTPPPRSPLAHGALIARPLATIASGGKTQSAKEGAEQL